MSPEEERVKFCRSLNKHRQENIDCDIVFKIGEKSFPAHRLILKSRMEFFEKMFNAEMKEKKEHAVEFDPTIVSPNVFEEILNYVYICDLELTEENAVPICVAADYFCDE